METKPVQAVVVTRHLGAVDWLRKKHGFTVNTHVISHLSQEIIDFLDRRHIVIGTLPIQLVADVLKQGARYFHLEMSLPSEARGKELSADDMDKYGATLQEYEGLRRVR